MLLSSFLGPIKQELDDCGTRSDGKSPEICALAESAVSGLVAPIHIESTSIAAIRWGSVQGCIPRVLSVAISQHISVFPILADPVDVKKDDQQYETVSLPSVQQDTVDRPMGG